MQSFYDYKKFAILYVDDEEKSLTSFQRSFGDQFRILLAANARDGFQLLEKHPDDIGVVMTDERMPGERGVRFLERVREFRPRIVRILVTVYSDPSVLIEGVNAGRIARFFNKPWPLADLEMGLRQAMEFFIVQRERDQLLQEKLSVLHNLMITDRVVSWAVLATGLRQHLRAPLAAMRDFIRLAPAKTSPENLSWEELRNPNYWREFYDHVHRQVQSISHLLGDLGVASTRPPAAFQDSVRLRPAVTEALERLGRRLADKQISVANHLPESLPPLTVNGPQFRRLCDAVLAAELARWRPGSHVELEGRETSPGDQPSAAVQWVIRDDSPGVPAEALRALFDPFAPCDPALHEFGTRLLTGYLLTYHHGGRVEVTSAGAEGSVLTLTFRQCPPAEADLATEPDMLSRVLLNETLWDRLLGRD